MKIEKDDQLIHTRLNKKKSHSCSKIWKKMHFRKVELFANFNSKAKNFFLQSAGGPFRAAPFEKNKKIG